jgi:hypothetical protein
LFSDGELIYEAKGGEERRGEERRGKSEVVLL